MKVGDRVRFVGDFNQYTAAGQRVLRRCGEIFQAESTVGWPLSAGSIRVRWIPKTKRGYPEIYTHKLSEIAAEVPDA